MDKHNIRILSVLPLLGHPRDSKRITMLQQAGFDVEAVAFERDYHSGRMPDCKVTVLGKIAHGRYLERIFKICHAIPAMRRVIKRNHLIYTSGADMAFMALVAGLGLGKPVVVEIGDIREVQVSSGIKGRVVRFFDKRFINSCSLLVTTTSSFIDIYYREWLKASVPAMVIENKIEADFAKKILKNGIQSSVDGKPLVERPLRIGYFGGLRCEWSWRVLEAFAIAKPEDVEIVLAGYVMDPQDLPKQVEKYPNVTYLGQYKSPQDLPGLYGGVDIIWGCYRPIGPNDWNLRWARPNRFYESCLFQKPIVSRFGSCDSVDVKRYEIGLIIEDDDIHKVVDCLCKIKTEDLETWKRNMARLPRNVYSYTTEMDDLKGALETIKEKSCAFRESGHIVEIAQINAKNNMVNIKCPYCNTPKSEPWVEENGFNAVKCSECGLVYVNPRPVQSLIGDGVETGVHSNVEHGRTAVVRRVGGPMVARYKKLFFSMFKDVWERASPISWLDVGAGYGEVVEAVSALAPGGSQVEGIEPMKPKAARARALGIKVSNKYLCDVTKKYDFVSLVNVYSHIPDFHAFLKELKGVLAENGEFYFETGNIGDLVHSNEVPTELDLPDHLVFAGEKHLIGYLTDAGFSIVMIRRLRKDGIINFCKNIIKKLIGRQVTLAIPYTSRYRSIQIRARLHPSTLT